MSLPIAEYGVDNMVKNTMLLEYIRKLRNRGLKIGLLSNVASNWIRDSFLDKEEQTLFDEMIFSFEEGIAKPNPRIFRLACERLGVEPKEAVMVDDAERHCTIARDVGMQAVVYRYFKQVRQEIEQLSAKQQFI